MCWLRFGVGSGVFVLTVIESIVDVVLLVVFVPIGVDSKGGQIIELFGAQSPNFPSNFENQFYNYSLVLTFSRSFQPLQLLQKHGPAHTNGVHLSAL